MTPICLLLSFFLSMTFMKLFQKLWSQFEGNIKQVGSHIVNTAGYRLCRLGVRMLGIRQASVSCPWAVRGFFLLLSFFIQLGSYLYLCLCCLSLCWGKVLRVTMFNLCSVPIDASLAHKRVLPVSVPSRTVLCFSTNSASSMVCSWMWCPCSFFSIYICWAWTLCTWPVFSYQMDTALETWLLITACGRLKDQTLDPLSSTLFLNSTCSPKQMIQQPS